MSFLNTLKTKLIYPIILLFIFVFAIFIYISQSRINYFLQENFNKTHYYLKNNFDMLMRADEKMLSSTLDSIVVNTEIKKIFLEKNKNKLYNKTLPLFSQLKKNYNITHFYFILPDGTIFLRVHKPETYGDIVNRITFNQAKKNLNIGRGIELGKTAFALRVVKPIFENGNLIGFIELGEEIDHFISEIKKNNNNEAVILVEKKLINKDEWTGFTNLNKQINYWNEYPDYLVMGTTVERDSLLYPAISECLKDIKNQKNKEYKIKNQSYSCGYFDILDANKNQLGLFLSLNNTTLFNEQMLYLNLILIFFLLAIFITIFVIYYLIVYRLIISPLKEIGKSTKIIASGNFEEKINYQSTDEIGELVENFNVMSSKLKNVYQNINQKVKEQTIEITKKAEHLDKQQKAILNVLEDVKDEKIKSENLAQDLEKFKLAVANASDHIVITDAEGIIIYANHAVETITGFNPEKIIGKKAGSNELWGGLMPKEVYANFWQTIKAEKRIFTGEFENKRTNGEKYIAEAHVSPILDKEGSVRFFIGIERDITKAKEVDRMKTEFISLASHQLRTPLSAMKWFTEMLLNGDMGSLSKEQTDAISNVYQSNERMITLVNSLLNISRIESGRIIIDPKPTNLSQLVNEVVTSLQNKIQVKKTSVIVSAHPNLPLINIDAKLIREVYANLLSNAIKYTRPSGEITIFVSKKGEEIISQIQDNGYGIPANQQDKIFDKFFRADNAVKFETDGNGLGLYLVKSIIESSKGKIWFTSVENQGTTFWFSLPISGMEEKKGEVSVT